METQYELHPVAGVGVTEDSRTGSDLSLHYWVDNQDLGTIQITITDLAAEDLQDHLSLTAMEGSAFFDDIIVSSL